MNGFLILPILVWFSHGLTILPSQHSQGQDMPRIQAGLGQGQVQGDLWHLHQAQAHCHGHNHHQWMLCFVFGLIRRVKTFVPKMCTSNRSHASIGGRHRRNLLTFNELAKIQAFLIFFFLIDSIIVLVFYIFQGVVTQERIFFIYHVYHMTFDLICMIVLPMVILYKSQTNFPDIWSNYTPKRINLYTTKTVYIPRRDSDNTLNCTLSSFGQAQEDVDFIVVLNGKDEKSNQRHMEESSQTNENETIMIKKITQKSIFHFESHCNTKPTEISIQWYICS